MNSPRPLYKYLQRKNNGVADLITKARLLDKLNQEFLKFIPTPVNLHVTLAHVHGEKLHVLADSPAWATKFRFMHGHILQTLKKNIQYFQYVKEITVSTRPLLQQRAVKRQVQPRQISNTAKICLESTAESIDDRDLQQALLRLASRHKKQ